MQSILHDLLITIGIFLPAYFANMAPVLFVKTRLFQILGKPIDGGKTLWGKRIFGKGKTYYGIVVAMIGGGIGALTYMLIVLLFHCIVRTEDFHDMLNFLFDGLSKNSFIFLITLIKGMLIGLGAILGDLIESFIKRRLKIMSGKSLPIFDQLDFIVGAWIVIIILNPSMEWKYFIIALIITPLLHLSANVIAYKLKLKKVWW